MGSSLLYCSAAPSKSCLHELCLGCRLGPCGPDQGLLRHGRDGVRFNSHTILIGRRPGAIRRKVNVFRQSLIPKGDLPRSIPCLGRREQIAPDYRSISRQDDVIRCPKDGANQYSPPSRYYDQCGHRYADLLITHGEAISPDHPGQRCRPKLSCAAPSRVAIGRLANRTRNGYNDLGEE